MTEEDRGTSQNLHNVISFITMYVYQYVNLNYAQKYVAFTNI